MEKQKWGWQNVNEYWNYAEGEDIAVEIYTSCKTVELFLNDKSFGAKHLFDNEDRIIKWILPYAKGELKAIGTHADGSVIEQK